MIQVHLCCCLFIVFVATSTVRQIVNPIRKCGCNYNKMCRLVPHVCHMCAVCVLYVCCMCVLYVCCMCVLYVCAVCVCCMCVLYVCAVHVCCMCAVCVLLVEGNVAQHTD